jgi:uncharacterized sulfatase
MRRRTFLRTVGAAGLLALPRGPCRAAAAAADRPSILFCIADDWSWPHAGAYGDAVVKTPTFDRLAAEGVLFHNAFVATPSCTPSRGAILTGQMPHRLEAGGNLWSHLDKKFEVYPDLLEAAGYRVGCQGKGWGPGSIEGTGRSRNPAGPGARSFEQFLASVPKDQPFCFWYGSHDPHRPYELGSGKAAGMDPSRIAVPSFLPDDPVVRSDLADYYFEVQRFDGDVGRIVQALEKAGRAENTLVVMTSDNGMPFPRAKANLYEFGVHMPLAVRWPARGKGGRQVQELVSFEDFAPTFLQAAGLEPRPPMTGRTFLDLLVSGQQARPRDRVFLERERHAWCRADGLGYPCRAVRSKEYLYVWNLKPDRWPAGDPPDYGDVDGSPSKAFVIEHRAEPRLASFFAAAFGKRPAEELFDLRKDPATLHNVAERPEHADIKKQLRADLERWMAETKDPRAGGGGDEFDRYPYVGREAKPKGKGKAKGT